MSDVCPICDNSNGSVTSATERMFGLPGTFSYRECRDCGCLYLLDIPEDLSVYYGIGYYSKIKSNITMPRKIRTIVYLSRLSFLVNWKTRHDLDALKLVNLNKNKSLLDVGCGSAAWLVHDLRDLGYTAVGVDPYITEDVLDRFGLSVMRASIYDVSGHYDIVMLQHSLEHMPKPKQVISKVRSLLSEDGVCIIRVPVVGWAWQHYGPNWVQLDAPRHL